MLEGTVSETSNERSNSKEHIDLDRTSPDLDLVRVYLDQASQTPLLSAEEEISLAKAIEAGVFAQDLRLRHFGDIALTAQNADQKIQLTNLEEPVEVAHRDLVALESEGDKAKQRLISANLKLVVSFAKKRIKSTSSMQFLDLIQEGNLGLIRAVEKFDYKMGYRFSTYASWQIRRFIDRGIDDKERGIYLPQHIIDDIKTIDRKAQKLRQVLQRDPSDVEIANEMDITPEKLEELKGYANTLASLNVPVGEGELGDLFPDEDDSIEEAIVRFDISRDMEALDVLIRTQNPRKADALCRAFGLPPYGEPQTMDEIAVIMGCRRWTVANYVREMVQELRHLTGSDNSAPFNVSQARK